MRYKSLILDTNLLLLYVVGCASEDYISKHKRLRKEYSAEDFRLLKDHVLRAQEVFVVPNVLTETSNLLNHGYIGEPIRTEVCGVFSKLIDTTKEYYCESQKAVNQKQFIRLGLTDSVLLDEMFDSSTLFTVDFELYREASRQKKDVINFNHLRKFD